MTTLGIVLAALPVLRCKSQERCSSDLPWRLVVAKPISDSKEVGR